MDPRSPKAKEIALRNLEQIEKLIKLIKKQIPKPVKPLQPKEVNDFYRHTNQTAHAEFGGDTMRGYCGCFR